MLKGIVVLLLLCLLDCSSVLRRTFCNKAKKFLTTKQLDKKLREQAAHANKLKSKDTAKRNKQEGKERKAK